MLQMQRSNSILDGIEVNQDKGSSAPAYHWLTQMPPSLFFSGDHPVAVILLMNLHCDTGSTTEQCKFMSRIIALCMNW